ncbi:MAG: VWA domain-containing protein [Planctomycetia bacterium]|nr:VWA domain-containing protein [Planctomycetia bacterium]
MDVNADPAGRYSQKWPEIVAKRPASEGDDETLHSLGYIVGSPELPNDRDSENPADPWWNRPREGHQPYTENTGEAYARIFDNPFLPAMQNPLSTFSIDVDTASYSNIRRMLTAGQRPPADAVRIEEMINYFSYDYAPPTGEHPFSVNLETASCPWNEQHRLVRVGLKGVEIEPAKRPVCNLVFLIDVSGSMDCPNKLPLVKQALSMLVGQLSPEDRVAMVVYAGASGLALPSTSAGQREKILDALDHLNAGGSTNGGEGIQLAYQIAEQNRTEGGVNRVILATDGDFNVGITDQKDLTKLITDEAKSGVFLSVLGFGMGNLKDATLEQLADKGNGNYAYIDTFAEAKKVLVDQIGGTLITIAKDVKIQIEFNPAQVAQYRLIGYENRMLAAQDFNDDKKDAGEIGAGHTVTALYEIVPTTATLAGVDTLKYQTLAAEELRPSDTPASKETLTVKLRYKQPTGQTSQLLEVPLTDNGQTFDAASPDLRFAASVAGFGMLLRSSPHKGDLTYDAAIGMAVASMGRDPSGQRSEFIDLVRKAKTISGH